MINCMTFLKNSSSKRKRPGKLKEEKMRGGGIKHEEDVDSMLTIMYFQFNNPTVTIISSLDQTFSLASAESLIETR